MGGLPLQQTTTRSTRCAHKTRPLLPQRWQECSSQQAQAGTRSRATSCTKRPPLATARKTSSQDCRQATSPKSLPIQNLKPNPGMCCWVTVRAETTINSSRLGDRAVARISSALRNARLTRAAWATCRHKMKKLVMAVRASTTAIASRQLFARTKAQLGLMTS